jgi:transcriptional regulator with XRE-family HTH domain
MANLADLIKAKIQNDNISYREFGRRCELSSTYIENLVKGDPRTGKPVSPTLDTIQKLALVLSMPLEGLLKEIGYIQGKTFEPLNLKLIRAGQTYTEISQEIASKTGEEIEPSLYRAVEEGRNANPNFLFINTLAKYSGVDPSFFYSRNTASDLKQARISMPYQPPASKKEHLLHIKDNELKEFVNSPDVEEYLRLAKDLYDRKIKVKLVRNLLFDE